MLENRKEPRLNWLSHRLALRQTAYTMLVLVVLALAVSIVEITLAYHDERDRQVRFIAQLSAAFSETAARAAFHIDHAQADAVLDGLMRFDSLSQVKIATDLGEVLAERSRSGESGSMDVLANWLFADGAQSELILTTPGNVPVGILVINASPEFIGRSFASSVIPLITGLVVEFVLFASALAIIFHRTLVRPLTVYANNIDAIDHDAVEIPQLEVPARHADDEFGLVVSNTNRLFARITEQREALVHREKIAALGTMLSSAAHELNNPLAVVTAQAQLLRESTDDPNIQMRADKILRPAKRCAKIVHSFIELAHQRKPLKEPLDMHHVIDDAVDLVAYRMETHGVNLSISFADDVPTIEGDKVLLSQAVMNLLLNAEQAMVDQRSPKNIDIKVALLRDKIVVSVADNGPGIQADIRHRVVEPFFTTKSQQGGTGLGLAFCRNVARTLGGSLDITASDTEGAIIELAVAAIRAELPVEQVAEPTIGVQPLRVLVVDDEQALAESFAEALGIRGHETATAYDGISALTLLTEQQFDVIVADVRMPEIDGLELFNKAMDDIPGMINRFVFVTGEPLSDQVATFLAAHDTPCLSKPIDISALASAVEQCASENGQTA
jgi:signal transduction histidine kinase/ActR/RegA family two-component response regulator